MVESVYSAVRTDSLYKNRLYLVFKRLTIGFILGTAYVLCAVGPKLSFIIQEKVISQIAKLTTLHNSIPITIILPTPVAARSDASACGRSLSGIAFSNYAGGMDVGFL